jgi:nucleoside-diphosphate-sugar epimerase
MKRVLITGATGGLGLALISAFRDAQWQVRATGRSSHAANRLLAMGAQFVQADLTDAGAAGDLCRDQNMVVHAAGLSDSWGDAAAFEAVNVDVTRAMIENAKNAGCSGFVFISSPSIYAAMRDRVGLTERDPPTDPPLNDYARTKLAAERLVLAANSTAFRTCALRPRALVGPDDTVLLPRLAAMARRGWIPQLRGGAAQIELTDLRDAAAATFAAAERIDRIAGEAINISGGRPVTVRTVTRLMSEALGVRPRTIPVPLWLACMMAARAARRKNALEEPPLTPYTLATLAFSQTFDLARARDRLGYEPRHDALATLLEQARARP